LLPNIIIGRIFVLESLLESILNIAKRLLWGVSDIKLILPTLLNRRRYLLRIILQLGWGQNIVGLSKLLRRHNRDILVLLKLFYDRKTLIELVDLSVISELVVAIGAPPFILVLIQNLLDAFAA
jgi:hypothetical protein